MAVKPGELVALVGPSGAGKSTITRLLLDFEQPEGGQILFDGKDLSGLDPTLVRGQMGTVMQNGRISRSTVLINIMGSLSQDEDIAWAAAEQAAIADDIRAMPMGMHTLVDPSNISGGQAQRLLIARALVTKPRILLMDEATSALDNAAQAQVTDALARLRATRVVIAHRLSTIRSADRVIVLDRGVAVQSGTFDELVAEPGLFSDLVKRQTADTN
jgi:ATP-binding cassette subfamily C protein